MLCCYTIHNVQHTQTVTQLSMSVLILNDAILLFWTIHKHFVLFRSDKKKLRVTPVLTTFFIHLGSDEHANETLESNFTCTSCSAVHDFVQTLLIRLNVTTPCCLGNNTACTPEDPPTSVPRTDPAKGNE